MTTSGDFHSEFEGRYVLCRCNNAGVHCGIFISSRDNFTLLANSRRLWKWKANDGIALSGVSQNGIDASESKVDTQVTLIRLTDVAEIHICTDIARKTIEDA